MGAEISSLFNPAVLAPLLVAVVTVLGAIITSFLGRMWKRGETIDEKASRITSETLSRMENDLTSLRARVDWCEARIRSLQERGHRWFIWGHELHRHATEARAVAVAPPNGWEPLPILPKSFDSDV